MSGWDDFPAPAAPAWDDNATFASNNHGTFSGKEDVANDFGGNGAVGIDDHGGENRNCNNCGQPSHIRADCTEAAKEFDGECNLCHLVGHRAAQCPTAPPKTCKNCLEDGHVQMTCQNPRKINRDHIESVNKDDAWSKLKSASAENDIDDMLEAVQMYIKAVPEITYPQLETALRADNIGLFIIATKREIADTFTLMDLQGNLQREWAISYRRSPKAQRGRETQNWPASPEENMERLLNAGEVVSTGVPKCSNCQELGHISKSCPSEKFENVDKVVVKCNNCDELGHRLRDCPNPRKRKGGGECRNCKQPGHNAKECPEPENLENVECNKCNEMGHRARDCPQGGGGSGGFACHNCQEEGHRASECTNAKVEKCRNCDEIGHHSRECPKPRDYSRVKCNNCQQMGHGKARCPEPVVEVPVEQVVDYSGGNDGGAPTDFGAAGNTSGGNNDNWDKPGPSGGNDDNWGNGNGNGQNSGW